MSVVILAGPGESSLIVANFLSQRLSVAALVLEQSPDPWRLLRRRAERQGYWSALGQLLFIAYSRVLAKWSVRRIAEICRTHGLDAELKAALKVHHVASVNDESTIELLRSLQPRVVVVNGTRIISERLLHAIDVPFINTHAGITPKYRGVHGAYWALAQHDVENAGVTVHLVDSGLDTGGVLYQARIHPTAADNFATFPLLQLAAGLPLLQRAVDDALNQKLVSVAPALPSRLYYHPTIWGYVWTWFRAGVK